MTFGSTVAKVMRRLNLNALVDSKAFRERVGAPIYAHHKSEGVVDTPGPTDFSQGPLLTVVVPSYNVADYLPTCLDSILGQSYSNLDVVVVNDGSIDSTAMIADEYARRHKRVRVIHKKNAGLGAARNTGLDSSSSDFITFVDSDDTVPSGAYERAIRSLLATGSDVCIGSVSRFDSRNKWLPFWVHLAHDRDRLAINGADFPPIMWDVFAWNKVYRRSTWDRLVGQFPIGTLYEDQECTSKLFVGGAKLDILKDVAYNWRLRDDNSSITQQKTSIKDLTQRLEVAFTVREIIKDASPTYVSYWYTKTLGEDLYYYIREVPRASPEFFDLLSSRIGELWTDAPTSSINAIDPVRRTLSYYTANRDRSELERLLIQLERSKNSFRGTYSNGKLNYSIEDAYGSEFDLPTAMHEVAPEHLTPRVEIDSFTALDSGDVVLAGFAFLQNFDVEYGYSADLFDTATEQVVSTLEITADVGAVPPAVSDFYHSYRDRRFDLKIEKFVIDELGARFQVSQSRNLLLRIHLHLGPYIWTVDSVKRDLHSSAGYPHASALTSRGHRVAFQGNPRQKTEVVVISPAAIADEITVSGDELRVGIVPGPSGMIFSSPQNDDLELVLSSGKSEIARTPLDSNGPSLSATLALPREVIAASKCIDEFDIHVLSKSGMRRALAVDCSKAERTRDKDFVLGASGFGYAVVERPLQAATASDIKIDPEGQTISVHGTFALDPAVARSVTPTFALVNAQKVIHPSSIVVDQTNRTFVATFTLVEAGIEGKQRSLEPGRFILQLLLATGKQHPASSWVALSRELEAGCPKQMLSSEHLATLKSIGTSRSVGIDLDYRLVPDTDLGRWNERRKSFVFISEDRKVKSGTVLFESFAGNAIADSPLALDRELARVHPEITRLWTVRDPSIQIPKGARPVVFGSQEWFDAASTSRVLVNNNNFPHFFDKHPDQFYVQTWHGTPLKQIGNHVPSTGLSLSYRQLMKREPQEYWNLLIAQSEWAGKTLSDAFAYNGPLATNGYPRNDVLADSVRSTEVRINVRRRFGINPGQKVVLYAPTWRDNLKESSGHYSNVDYLKVDDTAKKLGHSTVILYRGHSNSLKANPRTFAKGVTDVSKYPDINDLIIASDVLVTDYSSIMFDYAVTGKPMIFLCPDLEQYRDSVRGFYFDFASAAPGPIVKTASETVGLLSSDQSFTVDTTDRYIEFVNRFAPDDDGNASSRVVDTIDGMLS